MARTLVPDRNRMEGYLTRGLTNPQIVEQYEKDTGIRVTRQAISMALQRYGMTPTIPRQNYRDLLPWTVRPEHKMQSDARLLRMEMRRRLGKPLTQRDLTWLTNWKTSLNEEGAVVNYTPELGFHWIERREGVDTDLIRKPEPAAKTA